MEEGARRAAAERAEGSALTEVSRAPFRLAAALLVAAAVLLYSGTYGNPFVFDDLAVFGGDRSSGLRWLPEASFSLVRAVIDWYRTGINRPIPLDAAGLLIRQGYDHCSAESSEIACSPSNSPGPLPRLPQVVMKLPSLEYFMMRSLLAPPWPSVT